VNSVQMLNTDADSARTSLT